MYSNAGDYSIGYGGFPPYSLECACFRGPQHPPPLTPSCIAQVPCQCFDTYNEHCLPPPPQCFDDGFYTLPPCMNVDPCYVSPCCSFGCGGEKRRCSKSPPFRKCRSRSPSKSPRAQHSRCPSFPSKPPTVVKPKKADCVFCPHPKIPYGPDRYIG